MGIIKPKKLNNNDVIGIIAPGSSPDDHSRIEKGVRYLEKRGYRTQLGKNIGKTHGYLAGTDSERLSDLHQMFGDKNVKAIFCLRGGYGAFRLLDKINYKLIKDNPKIFVGYSEITSLQNAFLQKASLVTFAGPMVAVDFYEDVSPYTEENFWAMITSNKKFGKIKYPQDEKLPSLVKGSASGRLIGGNLAVFASLIGTEYLPNISGNILLIEDIGELPYKVDRMLNQLKFANIFKKAKGIILGRFVDCYEHDPNKKTLTLGEVIDNYIGSLKIPSIYTFPHGHIKDFITMPMGIKIKLNASRGIVEFEESAVR
jgi:muramoyltetrapeptide carboxypeptidase